MARKPFYTYTLKNFRVKAKNLKKKDRVAAFGTSLTIVSVHNNEDGTRGVVLRPTHGSSDKTVLVVFPNKFKVKVTDSEYHNFPENR